MQILGVGWMVKYVSMRANGFIVNGFVKKIEGPGRILVEADRKDEWIDDRQIRIASPGLAPTAYPGYDSGWIVRELGIPLYHASYKHLCDQCGHVASEHPEHPRFKWLNRLCNGDYVLDLANPSYFSRTDLSPS